MRNEHRWDIIEPWEEMTSDARHSVDRAPRHFPKRHEPYTQEPTCRILLTGLLRMGGFKKTGGRSPRAQTRGEIFIGTGGLIFAQFWEYN